MAQDDACFEGDLSNHVKRDMVGQGIEQKSAHQKEEKKVGVNDRARDKKDDQRRKSQETRKRRASTSSSGNIADWAGVDGELLAKAVAAVARDGGAVRLGYSRDGGTYAIGFYGDGEPFTEYVPPSEDIAEYLKGVIEDYGN